MRQSSPRAYRDQPLTVPQRRASRRDRWPKPADDSTGEPAALRLASPALVVDDRPAPDATPTPDEVVAGARSLARQVRALHERYEEEHRRLLDSLEFLTVQSQDLERELAAFGQLAETLASSVALAPPALSTAVSIVPPTSIAEPASACALEVHCLGGFEVLYQGRPVELGPSRNGRLIFKYLVARAPSRRASKELLAELFWPDTPIDRALASLHSAVHQLKRAMGAREPYLATHPAIVYSDDHYGINPHLELRCDVDVFRRRLIEARAQDARADIEAACGAYWLAQEAYGGELLPQDRYEDWVVAERASLEAGQLDVLARLVQLNVARGSFFEGIHFGRRLLELDSTREDIHRDVMRCHSRLGQRSEALRQYRRCFEALQAELEVVPEVETTALFERLLNGEAI
jgi:DNA-binding SARP family transcriptional activator